MTLMSWQPKQYDSFAAERAAPIDDLIGAIPPQGFKRIFDLGCGTGAAINTLKKHYPAAEIIGVDGDEAMLKTAKTNHPDVSFVHQDILTWANETTPTDNTLIFSNAALHWLDDHQDILPQLLSLVKNNGCLAVQMPNNWGEPSHTLMIKLAKSQPWAQQLKGLVREKPVLDESEYKKLLSPISTHLNIWSNTYNHTLKGENAVINWLKGSSLKYYLDGLAPDQQPDFLELLSKKLDNAYPPQADGNTIFPFIRMFIVANG